MHKSVRHGAGLSHPQTFRRQIVGLSAIVALTVPAACKKEQRSADATAPTAATPQTPADAPSSAPKPVISSTLDQIQNQFSENEPAARKKYADVAVQFTSLVHAVSDSPQEGLVITFTTRQHPQPITARFVGVAKDKSAGVMPGGILQVRCDTVAEVSGKPELRECVIR